MKKKNIKFNIKNGQLITKVSIPIQKKNLSFYDRYKNLAVGKYGISVKELLSPGDVESARAESRIATRKGGPWTPETLARAQKYDKTDAQLEAAFKAAKSRKPFLTRKQFMQNEEWKNIDALAAARYHELKEQGYTTDFAKWLVSSEIYGSE